MKKLFSFMLVLLALVTLGACIGEAPPIDDDEIEIDTSATYYTYIISTDNLNPYSEMLSNANTLFSLLTDGLYYGDYDWDEAIDEGVADEVGDFTNTAALPFNYFPGMAAERPIDVNEDGTVWRIVLKEGLKFEDDTPIDAHTFEYSYQQLLDPLLLNARAYVLYESSNIPLKNAEDYFKQMTPDKDDLGYVIYVVETVVFARANSYSHTLSGWDYYHADDFKYETGYYVEWYGMTYSAHFDKDYDGWALTTYDGDLIRKDQAGELSLLPDGTDNPDYDTATALPGYVSGKPAYMDEDGIRAVLDSRGLPAGGETTFFDATPVEWEDVGFKVIDDYTFEIELTMKKNQWQIMSNMTSGITGVVHPDAYETGKIEGNTRTTYGTIDNPLVSYGPYKLIEWVDDGFFMYQANDNYWNKDAYQIPFIRYDVINDLSTAVNEFRQGRLDVAAVSGEYYQTYKNSPYLKISPTTTFMRFAFSIDRDSGENNPITGYIEFRQALYYATDRETFVTDILPPGFPTHGFLGPNYYASETNTTSYRASDAGNDVLQDYSPETYGYNPVLAKQLFDQAYDKAVADGKINDGDVVDVEFVFFNAETNRIMADWLEASVEAIFGPKFNLVKVPVTGPQLDVIWDTGEFDITFGGWLGLQFWAPTMLRVYSSNYAQKLEVGFDNGNALLTVNLQYGKAAVEAWVVELEALETLSTIQQKYLNDFEDFLAGFVGDMYTNTYDNLIYYVYNEVLQYDLYEGHQIDFDNITGALEAELLAQMVSVPLVTRVSTTMYSSRVIFLAQEYHARMGWGGLRYMYISK